MLGWWTLEIYAAVWFQPTSVEKSTKALRFLDRVAFLTPNLHEWEAIQTHMCGYTALREGTGPDEVLLSVHNVRLPVCRLRHRRLQMRHRIRNMVVTLGPHGVVAPPLRVHHGAECRVVPSSAERSSGVAL